MASTYIQLPAITISSATIATSARQDLQPLATQLPTTLGIKTAAASLSIAPASDAVFSTTPAALTGSFQEILNLTNSAQTFTAPASVKWCKIYADDTNVANIRVKLGGTATTTSGMQFMPGRSEDFLLSGDISVITESADTNQKINVHFGV